MSGVESNRFAGVQALRGVAAMLVVLAHSTQMAHERFRMGEVLEFGASGVDVFFSISGCVMVATTYRHWGAAGRALDFLLRRLIRIVPLYWAATLLKLAATLALPGLTAHPNLDPWHVIASFLFIPAFDADHKVLPLLPVGWTLNFEMFFYLLFAIALAFRVRPVLWLGAALLVVSWLPSAPALGAVGALADPILLEFVGGMFIGWATVKGYTLPKGAAACGLVIAFVALGLTQILAQTVGFTNRLALWGAPGAVALMSTVALEKPLRRWLEGWPELVGDASYAIYLVHGFAVPLAGVAFQKFGLATEFWRVPMVIAGCLLSLLAGVFVHLQFEKPMTKWLNHWRHRRQLQRVQTAGL